MCEFSLFLDYICVNYRLDILFPQFIGSEI